jgi:hypothetical protein
MRHLSALLLGVFALSCSSGFDPLARYHEDGRAKPLVAIASTIDTTSFDAPWSLSEEFTTCLAEQLQREGALYVAAKEEEPCTENPFGPSLDWVKQEFSHQEFVVFLELVEHEFAPADPLKKRMPPQEVSTQLNMAIRMRVIDLRSHTPSIVLQEMIRDSYFIPKTLIPTNYRQVVWGSEEYRKSPMGIAHAQLVQEIAARVNDYVLLAKSR